MSNTVVYQESSNDFTNASQTIDGRQIVSVVYSPNDPTLAPRRLGEVWIKIAEGAEDRKARMWIAVAQHSADAIWEELTSPAGGITDEAVAYLDHANNFTDNYQTIDGKRIMAFVNGGEYNPGESGIRPEYDGQVYMAFKDLGEPLGKDVALWIANGNTWVPFVGGGSGGSVDEENLAKLDQTNMFAMPQKVGDAGTSVILTGARRGSYDPTSSSSPDFVPFTPGELYVRDYLDAGAAEQQVYISTIEGDSDSWVCMYDSTLSVTGLASEVALLDNRCDAMTNTITAYKEDIDGMGKDLDDTNTLVNVMGQEISALNTTTDALNTLTNNHSQQIAALEAGAGTGGTADAVKTNTQDIAANLVLIGQNSSRIALLEGKDVQHRDELDELHTHVYNINEAIANGSGGGGSVTPTPVERGCIDVRDYGAVANSDITSALQSAVNAASAIKGYGVYVPSKLGSVIVAGVTVPDNVFLFSDGAVVRISTNVACLTIGSNVRVTGFTINGSGKGSNANQHGIVVAHGKSRTTVTNCNFNNLGGAAYYVTNIVDRWQGNRFADFNIFQCGYGVYLNERAEYNTITGGSITNCNVGLSVTGGNNKVANVGVNGNVLGFELKAGSNDAHGCITGCSFNHNDKAMNFYRTGVHAYTVTGCEIYDAEINLIDAQGVHFHGCEIGTYGHIKVHAGTDYCRFMNCFFPFTVQYTPNIGGAGEAEFINCVYGRNVTPIG